MSKQTEALKMAEAALEEISRDYMSLPPNSLIALDAIREALAEQPAQQEPFGYFRYDLRLDAWVQNRAGLTGTPFYTSPPVSKPWVGLTDEEISARALNFYNPEMYKRAVLWAQEKLKERNK